MSSKRHASAEIVLTSRSLNVSPNWTERCPLARPTRPRRSDEGPTFPAYLVLKQAPEDWIPGGTGAASVTDDSLEQAGGCGGDGGSGGCGLASAQGSRRNQEESKAIRPYLETSISMVTGKTWPNYRKSNP